MSKNKEAREEVPDVSEYPWYRREDELADAVNKLIRCKNPDKKLDYLKEVDWLIYRLRNLYWGNQEYE